MPESKKVLITGEFQLVLELTEVEKPEQVVPAPKLSDEAQEFVSEEDYSVT